MHLVHVLLVGAEYVASVSVWEVGALEAFGVSCCGGGRSRRVGVLRRLLTGGNA